MPRVPLSVLLPASVAVTTQMRTSVMDSRPFALFWRSRENSDSDTRQFHRPCCSRNEALASKGGAHPGPYQEARFVFSLRLPVLNSTGELR